MDRGGYPAGAASVGIPPSQDRPFLRCLRAELPKQVRRADLGSRNRNRRAHGKNVAIVATVVMEQCTYLRNKSESSICLLFACMPCCVSVGFQQAQPWASLLAKQNLSS